MSEFTLTRREAVRTAAIGAGALPLLGGTALIAPAYASSEDKKATQYGFLIKVENCVNCRNCENACRNYNHVSKGQERRKVVEYRLGDDRKYFVSVSCMHCENPACMTVCPTGAITKGAGGIVTVNQDVCIGCKYCHQACPYDIPKYNSEGMDKCDCCQESGVALGETPHCVDACHFDALHYGPMDELVAQYKATARRVEGETLPSCYLA